MRIPAVLRSRLAAALLGAGVMAMVGSIAWAAIPDTSGKIHVCYKPGSANKAGGASLSIIDTENGGKCRRGEAEVIFNQQGPPGPEGQPGDFTGYEVVRAESLRNGDRVKTAVAYCRDGKHVTGGGVVAGEREGVAVTNSFPQNSLTGEPNSAWEGVVTRTDGFTGDWGIATFAICAVVETAD